MDALQARVRRLERINYALVGLCMLACLMAANGKVSKFDEIHCRSLYVVDREGKHVISLDQTGAKDTPVIGITKDGYKSGMTFGYSDFGNPMLQVQDQSKAEIRLGRDADHMEIGIYDKNKKLTAGIGTK